MNEGKDAGDYLSAEVIMTKLDKVIEQNETIIGHLEALEAQLEEAEKKE